MKFQADIRIMPHKEILDPQGKTVHKNLPNIGIDGVEDVRIGKFIQLQVQAGNRDEAHAKVDEACKKLLANLITERYEFDLHTI